MLFRSVSLPSLSLSDKADLSEVPELELGFLLDLLLLGLDEEDVEPDLLLELLLDELRKSGFLSDLSDFDGVDLSC